jgi:hypothetical protein
MDLVFDGRAVARANPLDDAGEHRRAVQAAANDVVGTLVGVGDPAARLARMDRLRAHEGEDRWRRIAGLLDQPRKIDGAAVDSRRRPGLQPADGQGELTQARRQRKRRGIPGAAGLVLGKPDVHQPAEESAGGEHHRIGDKARSDRRHRAGDPVALHQQVVDRLLEDPQVRLALQAAANRGAIEHSVSLRPGGAHRGALARIQCPELDSGFVGRDRHRPAQGIHLAHQMAFANAADGRIAGHLAEGLDGVREQKRARARPGRRERRLGAGMPATDHDHLEALGKVHGVGM